MCLDEYVKVKVKIPADLGASTRLEKSGGLSYWKWEKIDACIAPIVRALQREGIDMRGSCCGHGKRNGYIHLQGGGYLIKMNEKEGIKCLKRKKHC